jgi:uncharacterized membrane protein
MTRKPGIIIVGLLITIIAATSLMLVSGINTAAQFKRQLSASPSYVQKQSYAPNSRSVPDTIVYSTFRPIPVARSILLSKF